MGESDHEKIYELGNDSLKEDNRNISVNSEKEEPNTQEGSIGMESASYNIREGILDISGSMENVNEGSSRQIEKDKEDQRRVVKLAGFEVSSRKKMNWKRRARLGSTAGANDNSEVSLKRKAEEDLGNETKRGKIGEISVMDVKNSGKALAVAREQPYLEP